MKNTFSNSWKSSSQIRKQRKYRYNAPNHILGKFMNSHLSKELRTKYNKRSLRVRTGDKVKIMRGQFKGKEGKVEKVNVTHQKVIIEKIEVYKKDGSKTQYPINPSNLTIIELNTDDNKRMNKLSPVQEKLKPKVQTKEPKQTNDKGVNQ